MCFWIYFFFYIKLQVGQYAYGYKVSTIIFHQLDISIIISLDMRAFLNTSISSLIGLLFSKKQIILCVFQTYISCPLYVKRFETSIFLSI